MFVKLRHTGCKIFKKSSIQQTQPSVQFDQTNKSRIINKTYVWKVPRLSVMQSNQEYPANSVSNCKPKCLQRCTATFMWLHSKSSPWAVGNREEVPPTWQRAAAYSNILQTVFVSTWHHSVSVYALFSRFITLQVFLIPMTERPLLCWHSSHSDRHD
jgi:hypothetical protein